jgi:negative regulator of sigma E activity
MNIEDRLREALEREPAPADFKRKVMQALPAKKNLSIFWWNRRLSLALALAVIVAAVVPTVIVENRHRRGIAARDQLLTALRVTNTTLRHTKQMIHRNTRRSS